MELSPQQDVYYIDTVSPTDYFIHTVTTSAIQLNKEKTMSIELDGPLYLGSNSMQQQVDQNTADIADLKQDIGDLSQLDTADKSSLVNALNEAIDSTLNGASRDLDNLSDAGNDKLHALKSYADEGELLTDPDGLRFVEKYAHSTFDRSKFTIVGSPVITNDGIASGITWQNYLYSTNTISMGNTLIAKGSFIIKENFSYNFYSCTIDDVTNNTIMYVRYNNGLALFSGNSWSTIIPTSTFQTNVPIEYELVINNNGTATCEYSQNGTSLGVLTISGFSGFTSGVTITVNAGKNTATETLNKGSIDLKQFSITVDGVEVFSGNRTGIDTIKSDDYTVVGTPTISEDGVASGLGNNNYIDTGFVIGHKTFKITGEASYSGTISGQRILQLGIGTALKASVYVQNNTNLQMGVTTSDGTSTAKAISNISGDVLFEFEFTGTKYILRASTNNGQTWNSNEFTSSFYIENVDTLNLYIGNNFTDGSIDLNKLKIYIDGDLVYQPCLKIPYTESKTGSKIVNSIYRPRVSDMDTQFGYAPYYTLQDEAKGNYTVVGSPTISSDFVASGFSSGQAIQAYSLNTSKPFLIKGLINHSASAGNQTILGVNSYGIAIIGVNGNSKLYLSLGTSTSSFDIGNITTNTTLQTNTDYYYKFAWDGYQYTFDISTDNENFTNCAIITSSSSIGNGTWDIVLGANQPTLGTNWSGSIDLKEFSIYTDGQLAYEAVTDPNFTLPMGELYGLIGQRTLRDSYRNGINYWELYSNRDLEQGGSCTSGVEVTFARPFADTNYVLSVPYSAKSATAFTPTQTGDWIAKGKGIL